MNAILRLIVLIPVTIFAFLMAWVGIGFAGLTFWSLVIALAFVSVPVALVVWTVKDHHSRRYLTGSSRARS